MEMRPEIGISMFNCAAMNKWKRSVPWFPSYGAHGIAEAERKKTQCFYVVTVDRNVSVHYSVT